MSHDAQVRVPVTERGRRTRAAIVAAAAELMYAGGITHTSLDEVLEYSGAGKSQLYHYFDGKQDLVRAVLAYQLDQVLATQPRLEHLATWRDLQRWAAALLARQSTAQGPLACRLGAFAHEVDQDDELRSVLAAAFETWQAYFRDGFARMLAGGELRADADPAELAGAVMTAVQGGLLLSRLRRDATPLRLAIGMALSFVDEHRNSATRR